jgi:hypothetical protein
MSFGVFSRIPNVLRVLAMVALAGAAAGAVAAPVTVSISTFTFTVGTGYGIEASEAGGTKLDASFNNGAFSAQNFVLTNINDSFTFNVGTVAFNETSIGGQEVDGLDLGANFTFTNPLGSIRTVAATGVAQPGTVSDGDVDFSVTWAPLSFSFGNGGLLGIAMNQLSFTGIDSAGQTATVTLLRMEDPIGASAVPEPGSLALAGLALLALARGGNTRRARRG